MKAVGLLKKGAVLGGVYLGMFLLVFYSGELSQGIKNGLNAAFNLILPSMFIFMIFSNALMASAAAPIAARPFRFLARHVFRIADSDATIVLLSLVGGYPVGAKLLADSVRQGAMSPRTAARMLAFCVNCGPAFLISGVGANLFGSLRVGVILYLSQIMACLAVGFLSSRGVKRENSAAVQRPCESGSVLLVNAVNDAARAMAVICAFVVAFSALLPVVTLLLDRLSPAVSLIARGLLEVTTGCQSLAAPAGMDPLLLAALFTGFGGICVVLQLCAMLRGSGIPMLRFFLWRVPYVLVSMGVTAGLARLLPGATPAMSWNRELPKELYSVSPAATIFLALLCVMLLFFSGKSARMKKGG